MSALVIAPLVAAATLAIPAPARAADMNKQACIDANSKGQDLRRDGHLTAAREQLRACGSPSCPPLVRDDCSRRLDEVDKMQPTVVFVAKDGAGRDLSAVTVTVDGKPLADKLTGEELPVDPGEHAFAFTAKGQPSVAKTLVVSLGEKGRREVIVIGTPVASAPPIAMQSPGAPAAAGSARLVVAVDDNAAVTIDGQLVGRGRFDGPEGSGPHEVSVAASGMKTYKGEVDLRPGETRTLQISLEAERGGVVWPWIVGGAVVAAGAAVGGYFLLRPQDQPGAAPMGKLGTVFINNSFEVRR